MTKKVFVLIAKNQNERKMETILITNQFKVCRKILHQIKGVRSSGCDGVYFCKGLIV